MKVSYLDHYGHDSLPELRTASKNKCKLFVTTNRSIIVDREELQKVFKIKIVTPEEFHPEIDIWYVCEGCGSTTYPFHDAGCVGEKWTKKIER